MRPGLDALGAIFPKKPSRVGISFSRGSVQKKTCRGPEKPFSEDDASTASCPELTGGRGRGRGHGRERVYLGSSGCRAFAGGLGRTGTVAERSIAGGRGRGWGRGWVKQPNLSAGLG